MIFENYYLYRLAFWAINRSPRGLVYFIAGLLAELNFIFNRKSRRGVYANQVRVLPPETSAFQRWRMARAAFRHFAYAIADFFFIPNLTRENLSQHIAEIRGQEHLDAALRPPAASGHRSHRQLGAGGRVDGIDGRAADGGGTAA